MKAFYIFKCIFSGFSFAVGYTPNTGENGANSTNGQAGASYNW